MPKVCTHVSAADEVRNGIYDPCTIEEETVCFKVGEYMGTRLWLVLSGSTRTVARWGRGKKVGYRVHSREELILDSFRVTEEDVTRERKFGNGFNASRLAGLAVVPRQPCKTNFYDEARVGMDRVLLD
jgi:hypothetical protein